MRSRPPPSSFHKGRPRTLPLMSHSATSIADSAIVKIPAGPEPPAAARNFAATASMRNGSSPIARAPSSSTACRNVRVSALPKYVTPRPSTPSSVRTRNVTIGFVAFGFSEKPASGSSLGSATMPVAIEAIFIRNAPSCSAKPVDCRLVEFEAKPRRGRHRKLAIYRLRDLFEEPHQPRHVFDREPIRDRADQVNMNFGDQMTDDREVESFGHPGDLHPLGYAADPHQVDHDDVDRARLDHVPEWHDAPNIFAAGDRRRQSGGDPRKTGIVIRRRHVFEPEEVNPGILDSTADVDRLLDAPTLVDVAHQFDVGADGLAYSPHALDLLARCGLTGQRQLRLHLAEAFAFERRGGADDPVE